MTDIILKKIDGKTRAFKEKREIPIPQDPKGSVCLSIWCSTMNNEVVEAAKIFYYDRWLWESGNPRDEELANFLDKVDAWRKHMRLHPEEDQGREILNFL